MSVQIPGVVPGNSQAKGKIAISNVYHSDAYKIAVRNGFEGTEEEWLESLKGEPGADGKDGYTPQKGIDYFDGEKGDPFTYEDFTEEQLALLKGEDGSPGIAGKDGQPGKDGKSAYEYAKAGGYTGTEEEFAELLANGGAKPDWNAAEGEPGHVLNRTHYTEINETVFLPETEITSADMGAVAPFALVPGVFNIVADTEYIVAWNSVKYSCVAFEAGDLGTAVGNKRYWLSNEEDTGEPFIMMYLAEYGGLGIMTPAGAITATISIVEKTQTHHKLPDKYAPISCLPFYLDITLEGTSKATTAVTYDEVVEALNIGRLVVARIAYESQSGYSFALISLSANNHRALIFDLPGNNTPIKSVLLAKNSSGGYDCEVITSET